MYSNLRKIKVKTGQKLIPQAHWDLRQKKNFLSYLLSGQAGKSIASAVG